MTDNNKFIPKLPETKTEIVLNQEQQTPQEQKPIVEKAVEKVKETVLPTVHASENLSEKDKKIQENVEEVGGGAITTAGAVNPPLGVAALGSTAIIGGIESAIGEATDNEAWKVAGDTHKGMAKKPLEKVGEAIEKTGMKINEAFE